MVKLMELRELYLDFGTIEGIIACLITRFILCSMLCFLLFSFVLSCVLSVRF